jgi:hypothetical protein
LSLRKSTLPINPAPPVRIIMLYLYYCEKNESTEGDSFDEAIRKGSIAVRIQQIASSPASRTPRNDVF